MSPLHGSSPCSSSLKQALLSVLPSFSFYLFCITLLFCLLVWTMVSLCAFVCQQTGSFGTGFFCVKEILVPVVVCDCLLPAPIGAVLGLARIALFDVELEAA